VVYDNILGSELGAEIEWPASDAPIPESDLAYFFDKIENIHKTAHFIPIYESTFRSYRDCSISILEIGVACGGSLELWHQYFSSKATVVGIDGNPQCRKFDDPARNIHVRIGMQQDIEFLQSIVSEFGPFDIILDDGSHTPSYTVEAFRFLFLHGLSERGVYLVEDLEWCYMPCGASDGEPTFIEFVKSLIDIMHIHYMAVDSTDAFEVVYPHGVNGEPVNNTERLPFVKVPLATTLISSIELYDGIVVIHRNKRKLPRLLMKTSYNFLRDWLRGD
jgi:hypothetical protein